MSFTVYKFAVGGQPIGTVTDPQLARVKPGVISSTSTILYFNAAVIYSAGVFRAFTIGDDPDLIVGTCVNDPSAALPSGAAFPDGAFSLGIQNPLYPAGIMQAGNMVINLAPYGTPQEGGAVYINVTGVNGLAGATYAAANDGGSNFALLPKAVFGVSSPNLAAQNFSCGVLQYNI